MPSFFTSSTYDCYFCETAGPEALSRAVGSGRFPRMSPAPPAGGAVPFPSALHRPAAPLTHVAAANNLVRDPGVSIRKLLKMRSRIKEGVNFVCI